MGEEIAEREPGETVEGVHDVVTLNCKRVIGWMLFQWSFARGEECWELLFTSGKGAWSRFS